MSKGVNKLYLIILIVSSPYLLVFGDDRVHCTREQMILQVDLVRRRSGAWVMSAYFCPHLMFNYGYLIEFVCLKIDLIGISYKWVY